MKSQELTALFLIVRLYCDRELDYDIQRMLSSASLIATLWVIYMIRVTLKASYMEDKDSFLMHYVVTSTYVDDIFISCVFIMFFNMI